MKKILLTISFAASILITYNFAKDSGVYQGFKSTIMPLNAMDTGNVVPQAVFDTWLPAGVTPVQDVFVKPADGLAFSDSAPNPVALHPSNPSNAFINLNFYRWTEQMFLWLLSPTPTTGGYGSCNGFVFNSPEFYDVSATDQTTGLRTLKKHTCMPVFFFKSSATSQQSIKSVDTKDAMTFDIKGTANGANNLPVLFERETKIMFDVDKAPVSPNGLNLVMDGNEKKEVKFVKVINNAPVFYGINAQIIENPGLIFSKPLEENTTVQKFTTDLQKNIFIARINGVIKIVVPEQGQATGDALMAKNGSLVYYNSMVNDIYAVFLTMVKNGVLPNSARFPTTQAELNAIVAYAASKNIPIVEPNSLAMELKTSWIETTNLPNLQDYITVKATVPNYTQTSTSVWTRNGSKTVMLALVGMHIVGSVAGHPEMIWGSIEHVNNSPNRAYNYRNSSNGITNVAADTNFGTGTAWLFSSPTATSFNLSHMLMNGEDINAISPFTISGSDTQRTKPFGFGSSAVGLTEDRSNAQVIAGNNDVNARLVGNDVRKKYFHIGSTWNTSATSFSHVGTNQLSNTTMETYSQFQNANSDLRTNCFGCHSANNSTQLSPALSNISHIFNSNPLVP